MKRSAFVVPAIVSFGGKFLVLYFLLVIPWPFLTPLYRAAGQELGKMLFDSKSGSREISFKFLKNPERPFDARIEIVNPSLMNAEGFGPVRNLDFDTRGIIWNPCVLLTALILASPVPWKRRWKALAFALPLRWVIILGFLYFCIWDESSEIGLVVFTPFQKELVSSLRTMITANLAHLATILLWLVMTFRREDLTRLKMVLQLRKLG